MNMVTLTFLSFFSLSILILVALTGEAGADNNLTNESPIIFSFPDPTSYNDVSAGHDYVLQKVTLVGEYLYTRPGKSVTPRIIVYNQGGDDIAPDNVPVEAWLGETQLIPITGTFKPLAGGKSGMFELRYMIPHSIQLLPSPLTIKIDPWNTRGESGTGENEKTTVAMVVLEDNDWKKM